PAPRPRPPCSTAGPAPAAARPPGPATPRQVGRALPSPRCRGRPAAVAEDGAGRRPAGSGPPVAERRRAAGAGTAPGPAPRRPALVVELDRHRRHPLAQRRREIPCRTGLLGVRSAQREREPHDHPVDAAVANQRADALEPRLGGRVGQRPEWRGQRAGGIAERAATAGAAEVQRQHPHQRSEVSIASRAAFSASSSLAGSRPPARAMVSRPPPPPPVTRAATRTMSPARTPRSTRAGATLATNRTLPSPTAARTIAASPSLDFSRSIT